MPKIYFLYHSGYETGENLSNEVLDRLGEDNFKPITSLARIHPKRNDILIRWGSTRRDFKDNEFLNNGGRVLNLASSILRNTNKLRSLSIFRNDGINVPDFYTSKREIKSFPVLGRDKNHHGGLDIVIIEGNPILQYNDLNKVPDKDFYVKYIPSRMEYRVHVFNNEIIRVTKKAFRGHDRDGKVIEEKGIIKNDTYGWGHKHIELDEFPEEYSEIAIKAVKSMKLDFGAVDLLIAKQDDKPYILEVNSCPRLNSIGLEIYADKISSLLGYKAPERKEYIW